MWLIWFKELGKLSSYLQVTFRDTFLALALLPALPLCTHNCFCSRAQRPHIWHMKTPAPNSPVRDHQSWSAHTRLQAQVSPPQPAPRLQQPARESSWALGQAGKSSAGALGNTRLLLGLLHLLQQGTLTGLFVSFRGQCRVISGLIQFTQMCFDKT